jgi:HlyD family secretion protein
VILAVVWWTHVRREKRSVFRTAPVNRGDIVATISATGTVEPITVVDVGAQVGGLIKRFGNDEKGHIVDYGSMVKEGSVLAEIDDSLYAAAVKTAEAQVEQAKANITSAEASVLQMKANLLHAEQDWNRAQKLGPSDALSQSAYDQYQANYEVAKANMAASDAAVEQTKAALSQAQANLNTARINLGYCVIRTPVRGVIVDRRVNVGQTVVSSLNAPSLFLIAQDLKRIQVWAAVNEADVGSISPGQPVTFTVDALPGPIFHGQVGKIRLNATMSQNVVTYTVEVNTDNKDDKLLPYLTANVKFTVGHRQNVLLVPNGALRWLPRPNQIAPATAQSSRTRGGQFGQGNSKSAEDVPSEMSGIVWVEQGRLVMPIHVKTGLTDGAMTEVEGHSLTDGMRVVVGELDHAAETGPTADSNPFAPQMPHGQRQGQGSGGRR